MPVRLVIIGGGPGGNTAATVAATLGADVTLIERDIIGGAAHLWDCIPSKAMIATGGELSELTRARQMGLVAEGRLDVDALRERVASIEGHLNRSVCTPARVAGRSPPRAAPASSRARTRWSPPPRRGPRCSKRTSSCSPPVRGRASPTGPWSTASGSSPPARRTRPTEIPEHLCVIGSGRHRRRVHAHVQRARLEGVARRLPPAGAAAEGRRGGGGARGRVPRRGASSS